MQQSKVRYIKPPNLLKMKIGHGGVEKIKREKAQQFLIENPVDFADDALALVNEITKARTAAAEHFRQQKVPLRNLDDVLKPIMQLKANGGMFKYQLISDVADICLQFLESINDYEEEALEIIRGHENTLRSILENRLQGNGGKAGYEVVLELHNACQRYFKKHLKTELS